MKKYGNEFKVGLFVLCCAAGLIYLVTNTGKMNVKKEGYYIYAVFDDIAGMEEKAPVMLNGLEVGKVDSIKIVYEESRTKLMLKLWINAKAKIRENPVISIKTLGLMGEKYVQIASTQGERFVKAEAVVAGKPYLDIDAMLEQAQGMVNTLGQELKTLVSNLNGTLDTNKDTVSQILKNLESTSRNFDEFSQDIKSHPWKLLLKGKEKK